MDLSHWADVAELAGTVTILAGLVFGLIQVREYRQQRYDAVASELMRSFYDSELSEAVALLQPLADGLSAAEFRALEPRYMTAVIKVNMTFETMGLLVFRRVAPFDLVLELAGGLVQVLWRKLGRFVRDVREEQSHPAFAEWFEWLAMMAERHKAKDDPAYLRGADWKP
jgi:hypothetical protein